MKALPTLRRAILRSYTLLIVLYAALGILLVISVNISSKTTPMLLHLNYDSISAATRMDEAWSALQFPGYSANRSREDWVRQFNQALDFENSNVTEPGEGAIAREITAEWNDSRPELGRLPAPRFEAMRQRLKDLVSVNEKGMFGLAQENLKLSHEVLLGTLVYFFLSLLASAFFADRLSQRLSQPLKGIAEALHRRPDYTRRLKLPEPANLEMLILTTELKRLWERLSEAEKVNVAELLTQKNKLEALLESVEDALLVLDPEGRVSHCNQCLATLVGLGKDQIQGQKWTDLPSMNPNYLKLAGTLREEMPDSQQLELDWNGALAYFSARSREISEGRRAGTLYLLHDITEKKQRERFRSEFIDLLSHELKTPLQSLGTASDLLCAQKAQLPGELGLLVDTVAEDVERIRAVAQEFVQITQSQAKIMKLKMELIAINEVLPEWIKPFSVVAKDRGVRIEVRREGSEVIWANIDPVKFPWVVSNILSNAVRFSPPDGVIDVLLTDRSGAIEIRVTDQGPGIPEHDQDKIFEPFFQSTLTTPAGTRGVFGLGLTIAKEVVEAHDGRIEYHRAQPQGSEFRILLPFPPLQYRDSGPESRRESKSWTH